MSKTIIPNEKSKEHKLDIPIDQMEVAQVFKTLEKTIIKALKDGVEEGGQTIAKIHYDLFQMAIGGSEKARLSLLFLKSKFHNLVGSNIKTEKIGELLHSYSRHWFRLFLILESKAYQYIEWISFEPEAPLDYGSIFKNLNTLYPLLKISEVSPESTLTVENALRDLSKNDSVTIGTKLQDWVYKRMRLALDQKNEIRNELRNFQYVFPTIFPLTAPDFDEIFHEYAKAWFRHSLQLKRWFNQFDKRMDHEMLERLFRGYCTSRLKGTLLSQVLNDRNKI
ncbi:MAG: hypothetical protein ACXAC7_22920 [Candidatus Hodarchaeales archaeon]|jgi:hypothetical protein